jgi:hypothetical protein
MVCFTDPAEGLRCVATIDAVPSLDHAWIIVYADASPEPCMVGPTGALSGCFDLDFTLRDCSAEMVEARRC